MDKGKNYEVKDIKLAEQGRMNIELAEQRMGALMRIKERFGKNCSEKSDHYVTELVLPDTVGKNVVY